MKTKKINIILIAVAFISLFSGCSDSEETLKTFSEEALSFETSAFDLSIPLEDLTLEIPVFVSTTSTMSRSFNTNVVSATDASSGEFSVGSITIPAGEYRGVLTVDFDFSAISGNDGDIKELVLSIDVPEGTSSYNDTATVSYFREIVCNDVVVTINPDNYPGETSWEITDDTDTVVASGGSTGTTVNLADGCYTFTIFDAFGDGICCAYGDGSYSVDCSIINHASGAEFGASESTEFCVNP